MEIRYLKNIFRGKVIPLLFGLIVLTGILFGCKHIFRGKIKQGFPVMSAPPIFHGNIDIDSSDEVEILLRENLKSIVHRAESANLREFKNINLSDLRFLLDYIKITKRKWNHDYRWPDPKHLGIKGLERKYYVVELPAVLGKWELKNETIYTYIQGRGWDQSYIKLFIDEKGTVYLGGGYIPLPPPEGKAIPTKVRKITP